MKILKKHFVAKVDKVQVKRINDNFCIRFSTLHGNNYNHYFVYFNKDKFTNQINRVINSISHIRVFMCSPFEVRESKGKLYKYNVSELYLNNGKIISFSNNSKQ